MPFAFVLPTTSAFSFSSAFTCPSHPSLLRNASTYRGVVRDTLKKHKRLPPEAQTANLTLVVASLQDYLPYLLTLVDGRVSIFGAEGSSPATATVTGQLPEWRPTLAVRVLPGRREAPRVRVRSLDQELAFVLVSLGHALTLQARAVLQPLYVTTSVVPVGPQQRLTAITAATRHLLDAASVLTFAAQRAETTTSSATAPADISPSILRAHAALALAEATLLAVLKDDPYPAVVAQDRNEYDREWMYKAPDIPKVRAHLFARLCLAAADHAAAAHAGCSSITGSSYARYLQDLRHTSRAKACRFFALDAELGGQTGTALAWLRAARDEVGTGTGAGLSLAGGDSHNGGGGSSGSGSGSRGSSHLLSRLRKERSEKREDRRVERGLNWGADAGRLEETRVLEMLDAKWTKQNDTMNTQRIPPSAPLLAQMPSGREIHAVKPFEPPALDAAVLETMRVLPDPLDEADVGIGAAYDSSDDETLAPSSSVSSGRQYF